MRVINFELVENSEILMASYEPRDRKHAGLKLDHAPCFHLILMVMLVVEHCLMEKIRMPNINL